jgi:hypothetical protein
MNIKEFIGKYRIIVVLVAMIIIMAFVKSYFGNKIDNTNNKTSITPTPTNISTKTSNTKNNEDKVNNVESDQEIGEKTIPQNEVVILSNEETDSRRKELTEKSRTFQTEKEYQAWFDTLSFEDQEILQGDKPIQVSQLKDELPYEGKTFIVKAVISNSVIQVKSKIDDLEKAEVDVRNWLSSKAMNFEDLVISWE